MELLAEHHRGDVGEQPATSTTAAGISILLQTYAPGQQTTDHGQFTTIRSSNAQNIRVPGCGNVSAFAGWPANAIAGPSPGWDAVRTDDIAASAGRRTASTIRFGRSKARRRHRRLKEERPARARNFKQLLGVVTSRQSGRKNHQSAQTISLLVAAEAHNRWCAGNPSSERHHGCAILQSHKTRNERFRYRHGHDHNAGDPGVAGWRERHISQAWKSLSATLACFQSRWRLKVVRGAEEAAAQLRLTFRTSKNRVVVSSSPQTLPPCGAAISVGLS